MAGITLEKAEEMLNALLSAVPDSTGVSSVSVGGKTFAYRSHEDMNAAIDFWDRKAKKLARGGIRVRGVSPIS